MNAAARLVHQNVLSRHLVLTYLLSRQQIGVALLALMVLMSALGMIYMTHVTRLMQATYQHYLVDQDRLHVEQGQLLLERSTLMMQSRIQQVAETQLDMVLPNHQSVVIIRE